VTCIYLSMICLAPSASLLKTILVTNITLRYIYCTQPLVVYESVSHSPELCPRGSGHIGRHGGEVQNRQFRVPRFVSYNSNYNRSGVILTQDLSVRTRPAFISIGCPWGLCLKKGGQLTKWKLPLRHHSMRTLLPRNVNCLYESLWRTSLAS